MRQSISRCAGAFPDTPESFPLRRSFSRCAGASPAAPESFPLRQSFSRCAGASPGAPELLPMRRNFSRCAGASPGAPELLPVRRTFSRCAGVSPGAPEFLPMRGRLPGDAAVFPVTNDTGYRAFQPGKRPRMMRPRQCAKAARINIVHPSRDFRLMPLTRHPGILLWYRRARRLRVWDGFLVNGLFI
jgi:hypothetical protein